MGLRKVRIFPVREARVGVRVGDELPEIVLLSPAGLRADGHRAFVVSVGEPVGAGVRLGVARRPPGDRGEDRLDAVFGQSGHEIVEQIQVLVFHEVALTIAHLPVPDVDAVGIEAEARKVHHVRVDGLLMIGAEKPKGAVRMGEGSGVVDAEERHLIRCRCPSHHPALVDRDWPAADLRYLRFQGCTEPGCQSDEREQEQTGTQHDLVRLRCFVGRVGRGCSCQSQYGLAATLQGLCSCATRKSWLRLLAGAPGRRPDVPVWHPSFPLLTRPGPVAKLEIVSITAGMQHQRSRPRSVLRGSPVGGLILYRYRRSCGGNAGRLAALRSANDYRFNTHASLGARSRAAARQSAGPARRRCSVALRMRAAHS